MYFIFFNVYCFYFHLKKNRQLVSLISPVKSHFIAFYSFRLFFIVFIYFFRVYYYHYNFNIYSIDRSIVDSNTSNVVSLSINIFRQVIVNNNNKSIFYVTSKMMMSKDLFDTFFLYCFFFNINFIDLKVCSFYFSFFNSFM